MPRRGAGRKAIDTDPTFDGQRLREFEACRIRRLYAIVDSIKLKRLPNLTGGVCRTADERAVVRADGIDCGVICGPVANHSHQPTVFEGFNK